MKFVQVSHLEAQCDSRKTPGGAVYTDNRLREDFHQLVYKYNSTPPPHIWSTTSVKFKLFIFIDYLYVIVILLRKNENLCTIREKNLIVR